MVVKVLFKAIDPPARLAIRTGDYQSYAGIEFQVVLAKKGCGYMAPMSMDDMHECMSNCLLATF